MKLWIARDRNGGLYLYTCLPTLKCYDTVFDADHDDYAYLGKDLFPEVTFENSPQQVEIKLVKEE